MLGGVVGGVVVGFGGAAGVGDGERGAPGSPTGVAAPGATAGAATTLAPADWVESSFVSVVAANAAIPLTNVAVTVIDAANADRLSMCDTS